jgi:imidazolonepropionase-like amidohydrolase
VARADSQRWSRQGDHLLSSDLKGRFRLKNSISAHRKAVLPGLIDSHAHAGHGLRETVYTHGSD